MRKLTKMLIIYFSFVISLGFILSGCGETKRIFKGNYAFKYVDNQDVRTDSAHSEWTDSLNIYQFKNPIKSKIEDNKDYLIIKAPESLVKPSKLKSIPMFSATIDNLIQAEKINMKGVIYSTENDIKGLCQYEDQKYKGSFWYSTTSFALQALTVPLKFRKALDDGTKYPAQVETSINFGFAPTLKYTVYRFNPTRTIMGQSLNQFSINAGGLLNLGSTDLDTTITAPGLKSNRKAALLSYGGFIMLGLNNFNLGIAIGADLVLGKGHSNWVYQNKMWKGFILALDIFKP